MAEYCTVHQHIGTNGWPIAQGSEIRLPNGSAIPSILAVDISARPGAGERWIATIQIPVVFGDPIIAECMSDEAKRNLEQWVVSGSD